MNNTAIECPRCHAIADLKDDLNAWDGWQVIPAPLCPSCIAADLAMRQVLIHEDVLGGKVIRTFHIIGDLS